LDRGPPDAAVAQADAVLVQGFGNDDVLDPVRREAALFGQIGHAAEAARFLVRGGADLDSAPEVRAGGDEGLGGDDRGREPALHAARATALDPVTLDLGGEGAAGPAVAAPDHVLVRGGMESAAGALTFVPGDEVPARVRGRVARRAPGADQLDREARAAQPFPEVFADLEVVEPRRVQRRDADEIAGERDEI